MFLPAEIPPSLISPQKASAGYGENSVDSVQLTTSATADQSVKLSGVNSSPSLRFFASGEDFVRSIMTSATTASSAIVTKK